MGRQETQADTFQLDRMALGHGYLTCRGEKKKIKKRKSWRRGRKYMNTAKLSLAKLIKYSCYLKRFFDLTEEIDPYVMKNNIVIYFILTI